VIAIAKPSDIIVVQMSDGWTPSQVREEQDRLLNLIEDQRIPVSVIVAMGGGGNRVVSNLPYAAAPPVKTG
jgi:hypothetical protein